MHICYDYEGIEAWATGLWKAKKAATKNYVEFVNQARERGLVITFEKVKAHSGVEFNELADKLAKTGIEQSKASATLTKARYCDSAEPNDKIITERKPNDFQRGLEFGKAGNGRAFYVLRPEEELFLDSFVSPAVKEQAREAYIGLLKARNAI